MKFFPIIKYVDKIPLEALPFWAYFQLQHGGVQYDGVCTRFEDGAIKIFIISGCSHSKLVLFHELCHWFVYRITKIDSKLQLKLHSLIEKYVTCKMN